MGLSIGLEWKELMEWPLSFLPGICSPTEAERKVGKHNDTCL